MNWTRVEDGWDQLRGKAMDAWGRVAGGVRRLAAGKAAEVAGEARDRYDDARDRAERVFEDASAWARRPRGRAAPAVAEGLALVGLGAGLMYFLDPDRGRRRRALVRDRFVHALHELDDAIGVTSRDVRNRARGLWARARSLPARFLGAEVPDEVLVERVRSTIGRSTSHPSSLEVSARAGRVTLGGPILAHEVGGLLAAVAAVPGVAEVEDRLEAHERAGTVPGLQGGRGRVGARPELMQANWSPTARLVIGTAGAALLVAGARRRGVPQVALGGLGAVLLARAATNIPARRLLGEYGARAGGRREGAAEPAGPAYAGATPHGATNLPVQSPGP